MGTADLLLEQRVITIVKKMMSPAFDADVFITPKVSRVKMMLRITPNRAPSASSVLVILRIRGRRSGARPMHARANLRTRRANTCQV